MKEVAFFAGAIGALGGAIAVISCGTRSTACSR